VALAIALLATQVGAQSTQLSGTIVSRETGEALAHAIVGIEGMDRGQFATEDGTFFFGDLGFGSVRLHVRRIGFQPFDTTLTLVRGAQNTVRVALQRVAVQLSEVVVKGHPPCRKPGAPSQRGSALATTFTQMRLNAEQYELLTDKYPLHYILQVDQSRRLKQDGSIVVDLSEERLIDAAPKWRYEPGRLVVGQGISAFVHLPMLIDFASKQFVNNHCFHYAGRVLVDSVSLIRIDVVPAERLRSPDVGGSLYFDPTTFQIKRTVLELSTPWGRLGNVVELRITTDFQEILPSISVIGRLEGVQRMDAGVTSIDFDEAYEIQELKAYQFLKGKPGDPRGKQ
jgi:hypothetical protein